MMGDVRKQNQDCLTCNLAKARRWEKNVPFLRKVLHQREPCSVIISPSWLRGLG